MNMMTLLAEPTTYDPIKEFQYHQFVRHRPSPSPLWPLSNRFWQSPILRRWSAPQESDIVLILGNHQSRFALRNLVVDVIEQLQSACVPVLLATKSVAQFETTGSGSDIEKGMSSSELIKNLVRQAMQVVQGQQQQQPPQCRGGGGSVQTERSMARSCAQFHGAKTPEELFRLLEAVLCEIHGQVYLVIDLGALVAEQQQQQRATGLAASNDRKGGFSWLESFLAFFAELSERRNSLNALSKATVKVLLVSYDAFPPLYLPAASRSGHVVQARTDVVTVRNRQSRRHITTKKSQLQLNLSNLPRGRKTVGGNKQA